MRRDRLTAPLTYLLALLAAGCLGLALVTAARWAGAAEPPATEILWDTWGIPHLYGASDAELAYAQGWAQASSHGDLVLELLGKARGRAAEYWGAEHLESDRWVRTMGIPARAADWYTQQSPEARRILDEFARGINDFARAHGAALDDARERVLPVAGQDVLAHVQQVIHFTFVVNREAIAGARRRFESAGSNAWAVSPRRSASGKALLLANPHLPWGERFTWFEAQLVAPGIDASGVSLVGTPFLGIAFNDHLGWTHTVNTHDGADLYELKLEGEGYRFDGALRAFEREEQMLKVRQADGTFTEERLTIRRSVHGPVVASAGGKALALAVVGLDQPAIVDQYGKMARAKNLAEFEAALSSLQMPMFTVMYADDAGHILHLFGGRTPIRPAGDWDWSGIVPGDTSATLWQGTLPYSELPRVLDPPSGWLQNANDPPWTTTFPPALDPNRFPRYLAPRSMSFRAQRSARLLEEDASMTLDELVAAKLSTRMELADRILDDLAAAVAASESTEAKRAMAVLGAWDRAADAGSRGAVLFERFWSNLTQGGAAPFAQRWQEGSPRTTPDGLGDPAKAALALAQAARDVETKYGALDVAWGEVHRLRLDARDLPANGGPGRLGIFRVTDFAPDGARERAVGGDSYVAAIEFGRPVRARALLSYGNSTQAASPHRGDQLELFAKKELRPVWRTRKEVEAHLERREVLAAHEGVSSPPGP